MAKQTINLRDELRERKFEFLLLQKIPCTKQENREYQKLLKNGGKLPQGVYADVYEDGELATEFYTIYEPDLTEAEIQEYLTYKKLSLLKTIKNCVVFFTVLTVVGLVASFLLFTGAL